MTRILTLILAAAGLILSSCQSTKSESADCCAPGSGASCCAQGTTGGNCCAEPGKEGHKH